MQVLAIAGLFSFLAKEPPKPIPQAPNWPVVASAPIQVWKAGTHNFSGKIHSMGKIPPVVKEYGTPSLHVFKGGVTIRNFAWRGSMEGLHVGSRKFTAREMRQRHQPIKVTLDGIYCDDIGEDGIGIQPRANVLVKNSQFRGRYKLEKGEGKNPGQDKIFQIDGANVTIENCVFFNGLSPIRGKANSTIVVRNCKFVDCSTCVSGDGVQSPRAHGVPYDNGHAGPCHIIMEDCECWDCKEVARAFPGCKITLRRVKIHDTWRMKRLSGGIVVIE